MSPLSETQEKVLALLPLAPGILSMISSTILMTLAYRESLRSSYRRILFTLSFFDLLNTLRVLLGPFLVPRTSRRVYAIGNDETCTFLGALTQLTMPSYTYYSALSIYFVLKIRYSVRESTIATYIEPAVHVFSIGYAILTMTVGLSLNLFGEVKFGSSCWIVPNLNIGCDEKCVVTLQWLFGGIMLLGAFIIVFTSQLFIIGYVAKTSRRSQSYSMRQANNAKQLRFVASQGILFILNFYLTFIWTFTIRLMAMRGKSANDESILFTLLCLKAIFHPLMGFGNLLVYIRPRVVQLRSHFASESWFWAVKEILMLKEHEVTMLIERNRCISSISEAPNSSRRWNLFRSVREFRLHSLRLEARSRDAPVDGKSEQEKANELTAEEKQDIDGLVIMLDFDEIDFEEKSDTNTEDYKSSHANTITRQSIEREDNNQGNDAPDVDLDSECESVSIGDAGTDMNSDCSVNSGSTSNPDIDKDTPTIDSDYK